MIAFAAALPAISVAMATPVLIAIIVLILIVIIPAIGYVHHVGAQREGFVRQPAA